MQAFFDQHAMIAVNRDEEQMTLIPYRRRRGWIVDQSAHQRFEIGRRHAHHCCWGHAAQRASNRCKAIFIPD